MHSRIVRLLLCLMVVLGAGRAHATYNEWHLTGSDSRIVIDRDAKAVVEQKIALRVVAGSMRSLSLPSYPADAVFEPQGTVTADDGRTFAISVGRDGDAFAQAITQDALNVETTRSRFATTSTSDKAGLRRTARSHASRS